MQASEGGQALLGFSNTSSRHVFHPNIDFRSREAHPDPIRCPTELSRRCSDALPVGGQVTADVRQMMMLITAEGSGVQLIYSERIFNSSHR